MKLLTRSQFRFLRRTPWSAALAVLGVALGVASVVAVHAIGTRVEQTLAAAEPAHLAGLTHLLRRPDLSADDYFALRAAWRRGPDRGITGLVPLIEGQVTVAGRQTLVLGADWLAFPGSRPGSGVAGAISDEVLVGEGILVDPALGYAVGDEALVAGRRYRVVAVEPSGLGPALVADIAAAQVMLGDGPGALGQVGAVLRDPWGIWRDRADRLMPGLGAGLPDLGSRDSAALRFLEESGWQATPVSQERPGTAFAGSVLFSLGALGTLALLVAWFLIYQVGVIWLRRQRLLFERLQAVGVTLPSLRRSFLAMIAGLGMAATLAGSLAGLALAQSLVAVSAAGLGVTEAPQWPWSAVDGWLAAKALVSGVGVCLIGGYSAFAREWRASGPRHPRALPGIVLLAVVAAVGLWPASGLLGGFAVILAVSLLFVAAVGPLLAALGRLATNWPRRLVHRLGLREVTWHARLLDVALAALMLAMATGIGIGLMVESFRLDFQGMLAARLAGDLYVLREDRDIRPVAAWLREQPGVAGLKLGGRARVRVGGVPAELSYGRFDAAESSRYGYPRRLVPGDVLVSERLARDLAVSPGDTVAVGEARLRVAGVFPGYGEPAGRIVTDVGSLHALGIEARFDRMTVELARGDALARLTSGLPERFPGVEMESRGAVRAQALAVFDRTFAIARALTLLALTVAAVGMYSALTGLRLQQAATRSLLVAQGFSAAEQRRVDLVRAVAAGGVAVVLAAPLGIVMAWLLCAVINPRGFGWSVALQLPVAGWLPPLVLGLGVALLTGLLPAPSETERIHGAR